jgi:hypothetical protein
MENTINNCFENKDTKIGNKIPLLKLHNGLKRHHPLLLLLNFFRAFSKAS